MHIGLDPERTVLLCAPDWACVKAATDVFYLPCHGLSRPRPRSFASVFYPFLLKKYIKALLLSSRRMPLLTHRWYTRPQKCHNTRPLSTAPLPSPSPRPGVLVLLNSKRKTCHYVMFTLSCVLPMKLFLLLR